MKKPISIFCVGVISATMIFVTLSGASAQAQQKLVWLTSPDGFTLGMPRTHVWEHLGKPTETRFLHSTGQSYAWDFWQSIGGKHLIVISTHDRVMQITRDLTDTGRQALTFFLLRSQCPHLVLHLYDLQEETGSVLVADDAQNGMAWTLYLHHTDDFNTNLLNEIGPTSITVHRPGSSVLQNAGQKLDERSPLISAIRAWFAAKPLQRRKGD